MDEKRYLLIEYADAPYVYEAMEGGDYQFAIIDMSSNNGKMLFEEIKDDLDDRDSNNKYFNSLNSVVDSIRNCVMSNTKGRVMLPAGQENSSVEYTFYPVIESDDCSIGEVIDSIAEEYPSADITSGSAIDVIENSLNMNDGVAIYQICCWPWPLMETDFNSVEEYLNNTNDVIPLKNFKWC